MYAYIVCKFHCFVNILTSSRRLSIYSNAFYDLFPVNEITMLGAKGDDLYKIEFTKTNVCKFLHAERPLSQTVLHFVHVHFWLIATHLCINAICTSYDCL